MFSGQDLVDKLIPQLQQEVRDALTTYGRMPRLNVIVDPNNKSGLKYSQLKAEMAKKLGVEFEVVKSEDSQEIKGLIERWNIDNNVDGIMLQLPIGNSADLINLINPEKDVDGLREDSKFVPATVRAVLEILKEAGNVEGKKVVVVGNKGEVGRRLMNYLPEAVGMDKDDFMVKKLLEADVVISATGQMNLISVDMVKPGVIAIDVGYPKGDFSSDVVEKASFFTPVPGGVGPVTVAMLFKNLLEVIPDKQRKEC